LTAEQRADLGISEGFFRVSVGLEDPKILCEIFTKAIHAARN
jgi:O-succinylhomoserine sulfhydrylase